MGLGVTEGDTTAGKRSIGGGGIGSSRTLRRGVGVRGRWCGRGSGRTGRGRGLGDRLYGSVGRSMDEDDELVEYMSDDRG